MAYLRYRATAKVLCNECQSLKNQKRRFDTKCTNCKWLRYENVNNLLTFRDFLNRAFPNWVFFNVFKYIKGEDGERLASYQKGRNEPTSKEV